MSHQTLIEERVAEYQGSLQNKQTLRKTLTRLMENAQLGNRAYYELVDTWGMTNDYNENDDNHPSDLD